MTNEFLNEREGRLRTECYEFVRFRDRLRMLTFIKRDKSSFSVSYAHLHGVKASRDALKLEFNTRTVAVEGKNLALIHKALTEHRINYLRECPSEYEPEAGEALIVAIQILERP